MLEEMIARFLGKMGTEAIVRLDDRRTVNASWYVKHCIQQVLDARQNKYPRDELRGRLWHHDNISTHTAAQTINFSSNIRPN